MFAVGLSTRTSLQIDQSVRSQDVVAELSPQLLGEIGSLCGCRVENRIIEHQTRSIPEA